MNTIPPLRHVLAAIIFVMALQVKAASWPTIIPNPQREIWIAPGSQGGSGTYADPFTVLTSTDFDTLMASAISAGVRTFRLTSGIFYTSGCFLHNPTGIGSKWSLPDGAKFIGSGMDSDWSGTLGTVLKRDNAILSLSEGTFAAFMVAVTGSCVTVSDLSIDCNAVTNNFGANTPGTPYLTTISGVTSFGSAPLNYLRVERVAIQRSHGRYINACTNWECYTIGMFGGGSQNYGTVVSDCVVSNYVIPDPAAGTAYANAFFSEGAVTYRNCRAYLPGSSQVAVMVGFNTCGAVDQFIDRCYVEGGNYGIYADSFGLTNLVVQNSHFTNVVAGIHMPRPTGRDPVDTVYLRNNIIDLTSTGNPCGINFYGESGVMIRNIKATGNTLRFVNNTYSGTSYGLPFGSRDRAGSFNNFTFLNNTTDPAMVTFVDYSASQGYVDANNSLYLLNRTLDGKMDPVINNAPMNPSKLHVITTTSDPVASDDSWVAVRLTSSSTISLPSTGIRYHHTITILNDQGSGSATLTVAAPSGGSIIPTSPTMTSLQPNAFQRFMYIGSNTWQRN